MRCHALQKLLHLLSRYAFLCWLRKYGVNKLDRKDFRLQPTGSRCVFQPLLKIASQFNLNQAALPKTGRVPAPVLAGDSIPG